MPLEMWVDVLVLIGLAVLLAPMLAGVALIPAAVR
jgi:hypothetical protein